MSRQTPKVVDMTLSIEKAGSFISITVGSDEWFCWLEHATVFAYCEEGATLTARKQRQGAYWYWYGYGKVAQRLRCIYLGKSCNLTQNRLCEAMDRLYPIQENEHLYTAQQYGRRSGKAARAQARMSALYPRGLPYIESQIDIDAVRFELQHLDDIFRSGRYPSNFLSAQVLDIAHTLLESLDTERDKYIQQVALLRSLLHQVRDQISPLGASGGGEVF